MQSQSFKAFIIVAIAAFFAIYLGVSAATAQWEAIAWVGGFMGIALILFLGNNVWTLIPITLVLAGNINGIPGSPPPWAVASLVAASMFLPRFALGVLRVEFKFDVIDFAILLQIIAIVQAFGRAPTGIMAFGGETAGGKPYFMFAVAFVGYFVLACTKADMKVIKTTIVAMVVFALLDGLVAFGGELSSSFSYAVLHVYSNSNLNMALAGASQGIDLAQNRGGVGFSLLGKALVMPCFTFARPLNSANPLKPWLLVPVLAGCVLVALSGFRSNIGYLLVVYVVSALVRGKIMDILLVGFGAILGLGLILVTGTVRKLPFGAQRVLSVLPLDVDPMARSDAEASTDWRVEMWKTALTSDRYIKNKILGDGFAFSSREIEAKRSLQEGASNMDVQNQMLATGTYHGFHVETIRFTGALGLLFAIIGMIIFARKSWQLLAFFRGRPEFGYLAYLLIPFIIYPFWALFVFGAYRTEFPQLLAMAGFLKIIDKVRLAELAEKEEDSESIPEGLPHRQPSRSGYGIPSHAIQK